MAGAPSYGDLDACAHKAGDPLSTLPIEVTELVRTYRVPDKMPGIAGALKHVVRPLYREITALSGISMQVGPGARVACVGPNGAGKSTLLKILTGVLVPSSGSVKVNGLVPSSDRVRNNRQIGAVFGHRTQLWWDLPVAESLSILAQMYGLSRAALERNVAWFDDMLGIGPLLARPARQLSLGERMRCDLAAALLHEPRVLFLDEPTIGLDVAVKNEVREFLKVTSLERNTTLVMASHDLGDIEGICERLIMIEKGGIVYDGPLAAVRERFGYEHRIEFQFSAAVPDAVKVAETLLGSYQGVFAEASTVHQLRIRFDNRIVSAGMIIHALAPSLPVRDVHIGTPDTESIIRSLYKRELRYEDL